MFCNIFDMMLSIIIYRNEEINCRPGKIKNFKKFKIHEVLILNEFYYKK